MEHKAFRIDTFQHTVVKNRKDTEVIVFFKTIPNHSVFMLLFHDVEKDVYENFNRMH